MKPGRLHVSAIQLMLALLCVAHTRGPGEDYCQELDDSFLSEGTLLAGSNLTLRRVDLEQGNDTADCLNSEQAPNPPSCKTLQYALHESEDTSIGGMAANLRLELGPGVYTSTNETTKITNSNNIAIVGAGVSQTIVVCRVNGSEDTPCNYQNFQISNSSHVKITGITFTGCGPITSSVYIATSDYVFIDGCSFE